jgi:uncharacterized membrane-anchored protein
MKKLWRLGAVAAFATLALVALDGPATADPPAAPPAGWKPNVQKGPLKLPLGHNLTLDLPAEHIFINAKDGKILLERGGNLVGDNFMGIVVSGDETGKADWFVTINYEDEGYVKDDEKIDGDAILKGFKDGLPDYNDERKERGFPPLFIDGWSDPPKYDKAQHHLTWALEIHDEKGKSTNYNTRILGRKGYVSLNLVTAPETLATDKPEVEKLLAHTTFDKGSTYSDFDSKTDKVAAYGLAALVAGGAGVAALKIAKVGLLAKFGKIIILFFAKGFKIIAAAFVAIGLWLKKLFGGKDNTPPPPPSSDAPPAA